MHGRTFPLHPPAGWDEVALRAIAVVLSAHVARRRPRRDLGHPPRGHVRLVVSRELTSTQQILLASKQKHDYLNTQFVEATAQRDQFQFKYHQADTAYATTLTQLKDAEARKKLRAELDRWMKDTGDPRALGEDDRWDRYPYVGLAPKTP